MKWQLGEGGETIADALDLVIENVKVITGMAMYISSFCMFTNGGESRKCMMRITPRIRYAFCMVIKLMQAVCVEKVCGNDLISAMNSGIIIQ